MKQKTRKSPGYENLVPSLGSKNLISKKLSQTTSFESSISARSGINATSPRINLAASQNSAKRSTNQNIGGVKKNTNSSGVL